MASQTGAILQIVVGAVLMLVTGGTFGLSLIVSGVLTAVAIALTPNTENSQDRTSPTYGFTSFQNPVKGDAPIPVIYSLEGHKTAPIWLQAFVTPRGQYDEDFSVVRNSRGQSLSGLMAVAEGQVESIFDVRFNDEHVFSEVEDKEIGIGNGSKKSFDIDKENIDLYSMRVKVDGVEKGFTLANLSAQIGTGDGVKRLFTFEVPEAAASEWGCRFFSQSPVRTDFANYEWDPETPDAVYGVMPRGWMATKNKLYVSTGRPYPKNWALYVQMYIWATSGGVDIKKLDVADGKGGTKTIVRVTFQTAPVSGAVITASYRRKVMPGVRIEVRFGTANQMPIYGFDNVRNSYGVNQELTTAWIEHDTVDEVDDVIFDINTASGGFGEYDDTGDLGNYFANFEIEIKRKTALSTANSFNTWVRLKDPMPARLNKKATEFQIFGSSFSQLFDAYSVRGVLAKFLERNPKDSTAQALLNDFSRAQYTIRVHRSVSAKSNVSNKHLDRIYWSTWQEVIDEALSYPGTALLAFHALGTSRLNGAAPTVTCRVKGIVPDYYVSTSGGRWLSGDRDRAGNRVWCACDLITRKRYGAGAHYDRTNIDVTSALAVANWLDEQVPKDASTSETEKRSQLDIVLDVRRPLMEHLRDIGANGRFWVVLQGQTFRFVKDDLVSTADIQTIYDDTGAGRTAKNTFACSRGSVAERPTELQVVFLDGNREFDQKEIWVAPQETSTEPRRIQRTQSFGIIRPTEATRYAIFAYDQLRVRGPVAVVGASPLAMHWEAGDVVRIISDRTGVDAYWRIRKISFGTSDFVMRLDLQVYDTSVYGADVSRAKVLVVGALSILPKGINQTGTTGVTATRTS